jgi:hypothetical protein
LIVGGLRVGYERYYLPLVFVDAVAIGVLAGVVGTALRDLAHWVYSREGTSPAGAARSS